MPVDQIKFSTYRPAYDMGKWYDSQRAPEKEPTEGDGVLFWEWDIKVSIGFRCLIPRSDCLT